MVSNLIWIPSVTKQFPFQILSMHPELPPPFPSWLFPANNLSASPTFKRKERLNARDSPPFLSPSMNYSVLTPFTPSPLMTPKMVSHLLSWTNAYTCLLTPYPLVSPDILFYQSFPLSPFCLTYCYLLLHILYSNNTEELHNSRLSGTPCSLIPLCLWTHSRLSWRPSSYLICTFLLAFA